MTREQETKTRQQEKNVDSRYCCREAAFHYSRWRLQSRTGLNRQYEETSKVADNATKPLALTVSGLANRGISFNRTFTDSAAL